MGTGREKLGDTGGVETGLSETESGTKTGTTGTDDDSIVLMVNDGVTLGGVERGGGSLARRGWEAMMREAEAVE